MADLGSQAALIADTNAKVTTNGAQENTGARVNQNLRNIVDTIYAGFEAGDNDVTTAFTTALGNYAPINALGILYLFDTATTTGDPGAGALRYNNGTFGSITEIYFNKVSQNGLDLSPYYDQQGPGLLTLKETQGAQLSTFRVISITDSGEYYTVSVIPLVGSIYSAGLQLVLEFDRNDGAAVATLTYEALIAQDGGATPLALTVLRNDLGGTPASTHIAVGGYHLVLAGAFIVGRTVVEITNSVVNTGTDVRVFIDWNNIDNDTIEITCEDITRMPSEIGPLSNLKITITTYPT